MRTRRVKHPITEDLQWPITIQGRWVGADAWRVWMKYAPPNYAQCLGCGISITKVRDASFVLVHEFRTVNQSGRVVTINCGTIFKLVCQKCMSNDVFKKVRDLDVPCLETDITELYEDTQDQT